MLSANQIAVFFDHQYIWKESSGILIILHRVGLQVKAAFEKAVVWSDVVRFPFQAVRLHDSLIIDILGENQVISLFIYFLSFFMHTVINQGKVAFETTSFGCVWSVMLLVELDCRIPWSTSSLERIISFLSFLWSYSSREGRDYCFSLSLASYVHLVKLNCRIFWSSISLERWNLYLCLTIAILSFFFIYFLASFMKISAYEW